MDELLWMYYKIHSQYMNDLYSFWENDILEKIKNT
jgi:hypothetical protein